MNLSDSILTLLRRAVSLCLLGFLFCDAYAQTGRGAAEALKCPVTLYFRFDNAVVDSGYMNNGLMLRRLDEMLSDRSMGVGIDSIAIYAFSSPEGDRVHNKRLARERAVAVKGYMVWKYPYLDQYRIYLHPQGENWQGLLQWIETDTDMPGRERVVEILTANRDTEECKVLLTELDGGVPYRYIQNNILRYLRNAAVCMIWPHPVDASEASDTSLTPAVSCEGPCESFQSDSSGTGAGRLQFAPIENAGNIPACSSAEGTRPSGLPVSSDTLTIASATLETPLKAARQYGCPPERHTMRHTVPAPAEAAKYRPLLALKTNLLFDAAMMPNVEIEVPIGKRWSVNGEYMFPWWVSTDNRYCLQILSGGVEGRYWLGSSKRRQHSEALTGHFVGLYAGAGEYDVQWKESGYQGEFFIAAGVSYGWATNIARNLHLEMSIGIGFLRTDYRHYHAVDDYRTLLWQEDGKYTWLGPTKAKISLVWLLNRKIGKGGAR